MDQPGQIGPLWQRFPEPDPGEALNRAIEEYRSMSREEKLEASIRYLAARYGHLFDSGRYYFEPPAGT